MIQPAGIKIKRKLILAFIIVNLLLTAAGIAGILILQDLKSTAVDQYAVDAGNWYMKMLFGLSSLTFDGAILAWYFSSHGIKKTGDFPPANQAIRDASYFNINRPAL